MNNDFLNVLSEQIISAAKSLVSDAKFDKTEVGTVMRYVGDGKYLVVLNGEEIIVDSSYTGLEKLDKVYIKTRVNDRNKKYICGTVKPFINPHNSGGGGGGTVSVDSLTEEQIIDLCSLFTE